MNVRNTPQRSVALRKSHPFAATPNRRYVCPRGDVPDSGRDSGPDPGERRRAWIVDDEAVFRTLITSAVSDFGFEARAIGSATSWPTALEEFDPTSSCSTSPWGRAERSRSARVHREYYPWVSVLILTSFRSPELVGTLDGPLNPKVGYVVKSDVVDLDVLRDAIEQTLASEPPRRAALAGVPVVTRGQAEVLRLMAEGLSNAAIAQRRGCSARALERIIAASTRALGISDDAQGNARVQAVTVFRDGGVDVNE